MTTLNGIAEKGQDEPSEKAAARGPADAGGGETAKASRELTSIDVECSIPGADGDAWFTAKIIPEPGATLAEILAALKDPAAEDAPFFDPRIEEKLLTVRERGRKLVLARIFLETDEFLPCVDVTSAKANYWEGDEETGKETSEEVPVDAAQAGASDGDLG